MKGVNFKRIGSLSILVGVLSVCATFINSGMHTDLSPKAYLVNSPPVGEVEVFSDFEISGWAYDPDTKDPVNIMFYSNGKYLGSTVANLGENKNGFTKDLSSLIPAGKQIIYVYAVNIPAGTSTLIGSSELQN